MEFNQTNLIGMIVAIVILLIPIWKQVEAYGANKEAKGRQDANIDATLTKLNDTMMQQNELQKEVNRSNKENSQYMFDMLKRHDKDLESWNEFKTKHFEKSYDPSKLPKDY